MKRLYIERFHYEVIDVTICNIFAITKVLDVWI